MTLPRLILLLLAIMPIAFSAYASDATLNDEARALYRQIRCPVCESQTIDSSDTDTAKDMRAHVLSQLQSGKTGDEILNDLRASYGDSIIMTPPVNAKTAPLWIMPFAIFALGLGVILAMTLRKKEEKP